MLTEDERDYHLATIDMVKRVVEAALALYRAGRWELPEGELSPPVQAHLWENLRDALGLPPGTSGHG